MLSLVAVGSGTKHRTPHVYTGCTVSGYECLPLVVRRHQLRVQSQCSGLLR